MLINFFEEHWNDDHGKPASGVSSGTGFCISWQNGPLGRGTERREPNGAFVETIIAAAKARLAFYQSSKFACPENAGAIQHLHDALAVLNSRTMNRNERGVEGTYSV